jgi:hypothetical protein
MLDSFILIGAGLLLAALVAIANPNLMGWRSRRDGVIVLAVAVSMLTAGWVARML